MSEWSLQYDGFDPEQEALREALCTLGNGYFATRGAAPEAGAGEVHYPGTYVAGCYNRLATEIAGQTVENEDLVNQPNWLALSFRVAGGPWFRLDRAALLDYRQELDLRQGILTRFFRFRDQHQRLTRVVQRRFVHMVEPHLAGLETTFTAENWAGRLDVRSALDGRVANTGVKRYRALSNSHLRPVEEAALGDDVIYLQMETTQSRIHIAQAARTRPFSNGSRLSARPRVVQEPGHIAQEFALQLAEGATITVEKIVALYTSRDCAIAECGLEAGEAVTRAEGFDRLLERHVLAWDRLWRRVRIEIEADEPARLALNVHIFHLLQTVSEHSVDLDTGVPARGLHGEAYRGHIFWDELFILPFFNLHLPELTRALLMYRYRRLPAARRVAHEAGFAGAMFPWQSGCNGREETQMLHLNPRSGRWLPDHSHLQRHINAAIPYSVWCYYALTGDVEFLSAYGAEIILETARFWASIAAYNPSLDRYEISGVMGPDEYHDGYVGAREPGLRNNAYTNIMAVWVLCRALETLDRLPGDRRQLIWDKLGLKTDEVDRWDDISRKMRVVFHGDGIISQFEGYEELQEFDWDGYRQRYGDIQRLDRILEAEDDTPNRYKVSKQADLLMLFYLLSAGDLGALFERLGYPFEYETIPRNIEYYLRRTCHGSTLSRVVHSWVLARGQRDQSWDLLRQALQSDVSDIQGGTTGEGVHLGAMAGTVDLLQRCYTGLEPRGDVLGLNPSLPAAVRALRLQVSYRHQRISLALSPDRLRVALPPGAGKPIRLEIRGQPVELTPGETQEFDLRPA